MLKLIDIYINCRKNNLHISNENTFIQVVELWFNFFDYVINIYEEDGVAIEKLNNENVKKSIFSAFDKTNENYTVIKKENKFTFLINKYLFNLIIKKRGYLHGGSRSKFQSLSFYLLRNKIDDIDIVINKKFKSDFLNACNNLCNKNKIDLIASILPNIFFAESLSKKIRLPIYIIGSPITFLDFYGKYMKILLQPNSVNIIGIQHGGAYGEWKNNEIEKFEKKISIEYYGWGLMEKNIIQHRYRKHKRCLEANMILWIARDKFHFNKKTEFNKEMGEHFNEFNHIRYFYEKFIGLPVYLIPHPRGKVSIYSTIFQSKDILMLKNTEKEISKIAKLVIFDCISHSLLYYCIYNNIPFIFLLKEIPVKHLTPKAVEFYSLLSHRNVLFEQDKMNNNFDIIIAYLNKKNTSLFSDDFFNELKQFFEKNTIYNI